MILAKKALKRLYEGNRRFVSDVSIFFNTLSHKGCHNNLAVAQEPFAIIFGCSASRALAEIVFDQGLGDLFVIRVAGNIVTPSQIGSVEFTVEQYGARLVVVMGHSKCGAILATLEELKRPSEDQLQNHLRSLVDRIRPSVEPLLAKNLGCNPDILLQKAVRANIDSSANQLRHGSEILERLIQKDTLSIIESEYSLETGIVNFFDQPL